MVSTPRIPVCGGLITGVKDSIPIAPRLVTVNEPPVKRSGLIEPFCASVITAFAALERSFRDRVSALNTVGTISPLGVSTAIPRLT